MREKKAKSINFKQFNYQKRIRKKKKTKQRWRNVYDDSMNNEHKDMISKNILKSTLSWKKNTLLDESTTPIVFCDIFNTDA